MQIQQMIDELDLTEMPEGFHKVSVLLTAKEYDSLRHTAIFTGEGTLSAAIRQELGYPETPHGFKAKLIRMLAERVGVE